MALVPRNAAALLVGIGQYRHPDVPRLGYAPRDARDLAQLLTDPEVGAFPSERVVLRLDQQARREEIIHDLADWLPAQAKGAEIVVIFFAGHGMIRRNGPEEEGFLLPHDANPEDLAATGVPMHDVARWLKGIQAHAVVVLLDCCHAGKVLPPGVSVRASTRDVTIRPAILETLAGQGRYLIASCNEGESSLEVDELQHGLFTHHLLQGIEGRADRDRDGQVGVAELFSYVTTAVAKDAREKYHHQQNPWTQQTFTGETYLSSARPRKSMPTGGEPAGLADLERIPFEHEERLVDALGFLARRPDTAAVPFIFRCLAHPSEEVRERAGKALQALGWEQTTATVEDLARRADEVRMGFVLEGLDALKSNPRVVSLLDRLVVLLTGALRMRAFRLLERKRLGVGLEEVKALFEASHSPYQLEKVLGAGLFAAAYLARHQQLPDLQVVVRVLRSEFAGHPLLREEFLELSRRSVLFLHQSLAVTRDVFEYPEQNIYGTVRHYVEGVTLREVLEKGKKFEPIQIVHLLRQVAEALDPYHRVDTPHAGIKPSNIFITNEDRVILGDASLPVPLATMEVERLVYDFRYVPPERFRSSSDRGPAVDFYALGCVAYELLTGQPPFVADDVYELADMHKRHPIPPLQGLPREQMPVWNDLLQRLLAKNPGERHAKLTAVLENLDELRTFLRSGRRPPPSDPAEGRPERPQPPSPPRDLSVRRLFRAESLIRFAGQESLVPLPEQPSLAASNRTSSSQAEADSGPSTIVPVEAPSESPDQERAGRGWSTIHPEANSKESPAACGQSLPQIPGYEILGVLGRGGMGVVYKARQIKLNRVVALKMILAADHAGGDQLARFRIEAEAAASLKHPNVVYIYEVGEQAGLPYFAMEYVEGGSLAQQLAGGPAPPRRAAETVAELALAIHRAHQQGIIHRDLKPANVLLTADGTPKITDFGLAKRLDVDPGHTQSVAIMGTPSYMAPEQAQGRIREIGPAADIYALGAILYEFLTGRPPFRAASIMDTLLQVMEAEPVPPSRLQAKTPRDLETICLKCLAKEPRRRYPSAEALAEDLRRFLDSKPVTARPVSTLERAWKWAKRRPALAALLVTGQLLVLALLYILYLYYHR